MSRVERLLPVHHVPLHVTGSKVVEEEVDDGTDSSPLDIELEGLDANIMESNGNGPTVMLHVRVLRFMFGAAFGQTLVILALGFLVFQMGTPLSALERRLGLGITWAVTLLTLIFVALARKNKYVLVLLVCLSAELSLLTGFTSILLEDIAPIQFMAILFAQTGCIFGYTFASPRHIEIRTSAIVLIVATICVWCMGIFAFYEDHDWPTAIFVLLGGLGVSIYYIAHIKQVSRYNLDERVLAFCGLFVDPFLLVVDLLKKCKARCCAGAATTTTTTTVTDGLVAI